MPPPVSRHRYARVYHPYAGRVDPRRRRQLLAVAAELPQTPGIYRFYGYQDRLLYVGKAVSLRERVRSYFAETTLRRSAKLRRILAEVNRLEFTPCGSEFEALLLERRSIATLGPLLNREHKRFGIYPYLLLTAEEYPRLAMTRTEPVAGGATGEAQPVAIGLPPLETPPLAGELPGRYFGPFTTPELAQATYNIVRDLFPLRTCEGKLRPDPTGRDCYYHDIGRCLAPCVAAVGALQYGKLCAELKQLLATGESPQSRQLRERMEEHAVAWRFEEAAALREQLRVLAMATTRLQRMQRMRDANNVVVLQPSQDGLPSFNAFLVRGGAVRRHLHTDDWALLRQAIEEVYIPSEDAIEFTGKIELDEMLLIDRWLRRHGEEACCAWMGGATKRESQSAVRKLRSWARSMQQASA